MSSQPQGGEEHWALRRMMDAGVVKSPTGGIGCGSPWAEYGPNLSLVTPPGEYAVRLAVAEHPELGAENAAAELKIEESSPVRWEPLLSTLDQWLGYEASAGVGAFGAPAAFGPVLEGNATSEDLPDTLFADPHPGHLTIDGGDRGTIVAFTVGPQDQDCRTWVGLGPDESPVMLLTDLGLINADPTRRPMP